MTHKGGSMTTVIPSHPELTLTSIEKQLTARVLECKRGGFIIIFEGHSIAARSNWTEVLEAMDEAGVEYLGVHPRECMPSFMQPVPPSVKDRIKDAYERAKSAVNIIIAAAIAALGMFAVKIT